MLISLWKVCVLTQIILRETLHFFQGLSHLCLVICVQSRNANEPFFTVLELKALISIHPVTASSFSLSFPNHQLNLMAITTFPSRPPSLTSSDEDKQVILWTVPCKFAFALFIYLLIYNPQQKCCRCCKKWRFRQWGRFGFLIDRMTLEPKTRLKSAFFNAVFFSVIGRIHL